MSAESEGVKKWRKTVKETMVKSMGGKCCICGYNKCNEALELHHLDPSLKKFSFGQIMASPKSWEKIIVEIKKCVLVCSNCHKEVHNDFSKIPEDAFRFDEKYTFYNNKPKIKMSPCEVCGKMKPIFNKTCSSECAGKKAWRTDWNSLNIEKLIGEGYSLEKIGSMVGVSGCAVKKRLKKLIRERSITG